MGNKVYVAFTENHDYTSNFHGVFSTAKRAKAVFEGVGYEDWVRAGGRVNGHWYVNDNENLRDYIVFKTHIDDVIGYLS